jgi:6-pyruvoyltetrahydropterin/6-carboxytetrahydropterin synthase
MHGHSWKVAVTVSSRNLQVSGPATGMVMDFGSLKAIVNPLIEQLDHRVLNDIEGLENPTSEVLAAWLFDRIANGMSRALHPCLLTAVRVDETCTSACAFVWKEARS